MLTLRQVLSPVLSMALIGLLLPLGGCVTTGAGQVLSAAAGFTVTQNELDGARSTYDGAVLVPLKHYAVLPRCPRGQSISAAAPCHDKALLKKMRGADSAVERAFNSTQAQITSGSNSGALAAWNTLQTAIEAAKSLIATSGASAL
jgi:hypothetical protein